ncbi:MAG: hypothetical protein CM15mP58_11370 [Burkholderiaceae bacterium]|nr:MAG: hypothetical protein CM15mP58_11370 [Burkholderiaceae bacterium]
MYWSTSNKENFNFLKTRCRRNYRNFNSQFAKILDQQKWIGAIDSLGSKALSGVCAHTCAGCRSGLAAMHRVWTFQTSVAPFILRVLTYLVWTAYTKLLPTEKSMELLAECLTITILENISTGTSI